MACSTKSLKFLTIFWDAIYALFGLAIIAVGVYVIIKFESYYTFSFAFIGVGIIILLTALFGALAAWRESSFISRTFIGIVILLVILQFLALGFLWFFQPPILIHVNNAFDHLWGGQEVPIKPGTVSRIANLERWFDCCGNIGPSDYLLPPYSCYNDNTRLNIQGCRQRILDYISERWIAFNVFALALVVVELICVSITYVLANSIINRWRRSKYYPK